MGFDFPSEKVTTPLSLDHYLWRRYVFPKLDKVGLGWATFQTWRKTNQGTDSASAWRSTPARS
jgi:hypothetical protein